MATRSGVASCNSSVWGEAPHIFSADITGRVALDGGRCDGVDPVGAVRRGGTGLVDRGQERRWRRGVQWPWTGGVGSLRAVPSQAAAVRCDRAVGEVGVQEEQRTGDEDVSEQFGYFIVC